MKGQTVHAHPNSDHLRRLKERTRQPKHKHEEDRQEVQVNLQGTHWNPFRSDLTKRPSTSRESNRRVCWFWPHPKRTMRRQSSKHWRSMLKPAAICSCCWARVVREGTESIDEGIIRTLTCCWRTLGWWRIATVWFARHFISTSIRRRLTFIMGCSMMRSLVLLMDIRRRGRARIRRCWWVGLLGMIKRNSRTRRGLE